MQPDSLVFLVIVAMWAAYFVQYWVRRREHLATVRSVDEFTETMRVLERRRSLPTTDLSTPSRASYAVSLARAARPQVTVKRAEATPVTAPSRSASGIASPEPAGRPGRAGAPTPRLVRTALLALAALAVPTVVALAATGLVGWPWVAAPVVTLVLVVGVLRQSAKVAVAERGRAARRAAELAVGTADVPTKAPVAHVEPADRFAEPEAAPSATVVAEAAVPEPVAAGPEAAPAPQPEVEYVMEHRILVDEDDIPLTWDPVPVPRPTYTLKAKAERREHAPAEVTPTGSLLAAEDDQPNRSAHTA